MPVSLVLSVIAIVGAGLAALGMLALIRLGEYRRAPRRRRPGEERSLGRYQPMMRLLAAEDADFLGQNTSCPKVAGRWERSRRRIIRLYLKELAGDFRGLHAKARLLVAESPEQNAALVPVLFKQQIAFWRTLAIIEVRLAVDGLNLGGLKLGGLGLGRLNAEDLVRTIETMRREIARAAATAA